MDEATAPAAPAIDVEVAYALPDRQRLVALSVADGTAVREVLALSGLADAFPEIDPVTCPIGVFGRVVDDDYRLRTGDRVEIYRELRVNPRQARRERARRRQEESG